MKPSSNLMRTAALSLACLWSMPGHALQTKEVRDGVAVEAIIAAGEPTRIRVEGAKITDVVGNIYSSTCAPKGDQATAAVPATPAANPQGEFVLGCDLEKGEVFISPVKQPANQDGPAKPINVFISTEKATYTLLLRRADVPADTIVLVDKGLRANTAPKAAKSSQHVRTLKEMLLVMTGARSADDVTTDVVNREQLLWQEVRFVLVRQFRGRGMIGEEYRLTNTSAETIVLAEQEFDRPGAAVLSVSIDNLNLRPNESTAVFVVRAEE